MQTLCNSLSVAGYVNIMDTTNPCDRTRIWTKVKEFGGVITALS